MDSVQMVHSKQCAKGNGSNLQKHPFSKSADELTLFYFNDSFMQR